MSSLSRFELKSPDHTCSLASKSYFHRLFRGSNTFRMLLFNVSYIRERSFLQIFDRRRLKLPEVRAVTARFVPFCPFLRFILFQKDNRDRKRVRNYCFEVSKAKFARNSELRAVFCRHFTPDSLGSGRVRARLGAVSSASRSSQVWLGLLMTVSESVTNLARLQFEYCRYGEHFGSHFRKSQRASFEHLLCVPP